MNQLRWLQECWQKGMVLRDTDWLCYQVNSQGPCGLSQRIVYTKRCRPYTSHSTSSACALWRHASCWRMIPTLPAPTTPSAIRAIASTLKTQRLVEWLKGVGWLQISLENTLASAHRLLASLSWKANAGLVTCRDPARTESKWQKAATAKFCAEKIPVLHSWISLSFLVPETSATNLLGYSAGFYFPMLQDFSPQRRRLSLRRTKESQTRVHLSWVIQFYALPAQQCIVPAKM